MKYKKLLVVLVLSATLMSCQQVQPPANDIEDNTVNQEQAVDQTESETEAEKPIEVVESVFLVPVSTVRDKKEYWGFAKSNDLNDLVIPYAYDEVSFFNKKFAYAIVKKDGQIGLIDDEKRSLIAFGEYETLYEAGDGLLYGTRNDKKNVIMNHNNEVYAEFDEGSYIYNSQGILEIQTKGKSQYFEPITKQVMDFPEGLDYVQKELFLKTVDKPFEIVLDETSQKYKLYRAGKLISDEAYDHVEALDNFLIVGQKLDHEYLDDLYSLGLLDQKGHVLIDVDYYDIYQLQGDYFAVAENYNYDMDYKRYSKNVYKKAIFNRTKAVTGFDYYIIEPVKDSLFYVYDGNTYHFIDVSTGETLSIGLEGPYKFKVAGETIIAIYDDYDDKAISYIRDNKIVKKVVKTYHLDAGIILKKFKSAGINPVFYPKVALTNAEVENIINMDLEKKFDTAIPKVENSDEAYTMVTDLSFHVDQYKSLLQFTQSAYWYGLGAAHGNYGETSVNYDLLTGQEVLLRDLFKSDVDVDQVLASLLQKFAVDDDRLYESVSEMTPEEALAYFKRDDYNYRLSEKGLVIYYNPYDIGPYAAGIVDFLIPFEALDDYLNTDLKVLNNE